MNVYDHVLSYSCANYHPALHVKKLFLSLWVWAFITLSLSVGRVVNRVRVSWMGVGGLVASLWPRYGDGSGRSNHLLSCSDDPLQLFPLHCGAAGVPRSASIG